MLEFMASALITILPDFLFRRYAQGKRIGEEITFYSVWYELRWGISSCLILTVTLITMIFFYHPTTSNVSSLFRTVSILSESGGRVDEVYVKTHQKVAAGDKIFKLDSSQQEAEVRSGERRIDQIDAQMLLAVSELASATGRVAQAKGSYDQAQQELQRKREIRERNSTVVSEKELDLLLSATESKKGAWDAAIGERDSVLTKIETVLPAEKSVAEAAVEEARIALSKTVIYAGVSGTIQQFVLQPGDIVNPFLRPAGILVPDNVGANRFQAGFGQIAANVIKKGMIAEITCISKPFTIIPMVVAEVQDVIASGQFRPGDRLVDAQDLAQPGTVLATLVPLYEGQTDGIPAGSKCIANAYSDHHDLIASGEMGTLGNTYYHMVDALGIAHAILLRVQAMLLPVQILVLTGH